MVQYASIRSCLIHSKNPGIRSCVTSSFFLTSSEVSFFAWTTRTSFTSTKHQKISRVFRSHHEKTVFEAEISEPTIQGFPMSVPHKKKVLSGAGVGCLPASCARCSAAAFHSKASRSAFCTEPFSLSTCEQHRKSFGTRGANHFQLVTMQ